MIFWSFSPLYIVFTEVSPVWLVLMVSSMVVLLIPVMALALIKITSDESLMGEYKNHWMTNAVMVVLVLVSIYISYVNIVDWLSPWF